MIDWEILTYRTCWKLTKLPLTPSSFKAFTPFTPWRLTSSLVSFATFPIPWLQREMIQQVSKGWLVEKYWHTCRKLTELPSTPSSSEAFTPFTPWRLTSSSISFARFPIPWLRERWFNKSVRDNWLSNSAILVNNSRSFPQRHRPLKPSHLLHHGAWRKRLFRYPTLQYHPGRRRRAIIDVRLVRI